MSHTARVRLAMQNRPALEAAVKAVGGTIAFDAVGQLYERKEKLKGTVIKLPGWTFPVIITPDHVAHYDTYNGRWGDESVLKNLKRTYTEITARLRMLAEGRQMTARVELPNGWTRLEFA